jgi:hypothetical protein
VQALIVDLQKRLRISMPKGQLILNIGDGGLFQNAEVRMCGIVEQKAVDKAPEPRASLTDR